MISQGSTLWKYLSAEQQKLARDGMWLVDDRKNHPTQALSDYSYLVFPFAKLYEGFLKQLFLDLKIITSVDYRSDHFRLGKALSPHIAKRLGERSAYTQVSQRFGESHARIVWNAWKQGRNTVFHYFPHNYRALSLDEARQRINQIIWAMENSVEVLQSQR